MKGGGGSRSQNNAYFKLPPYLVPFRAKTLMNYIDYGGSSLYPQAVTRGGTASHPQAVTTLADPGGTPSSGIVTAFGLILLLRLPLIKKNSNTCTDQFNFLSYVTIVLMSQENAIQISFISQSYHKPAAKQ